MNLLSSIVSGADNIINSLLGNLMNICFYAERTILKASADGIQISVDGLKAVILTFSIGLIILKFLKKGFDMYIMWTERRIRASYWNLCDVFC